MIRMQLRELKEKKGLTNKELAELSGVSLTTVERIMSGKTDVPNYQTVCDLVMAMGGSLDELAGISRADAPANREVIDLYVKTIAEKDKWIRRLFIICCALMIVIIGITLYDLLNPTIGYIQR